MSRLVNVKEVIHDAIKRHAGLSDFDDEPIGWEVEAILKALKQNGYKVVENERSILACRHR